MHLTVGIHPNIPEAIYHADPAETPSASSGILRTIYQQSPAHAFRAHPRLNPEFTPGPSTDAMNAGSILHAVILGQPEPWRAIQADDFRTNAAKAARDAAIAAGLLPILQHKLDALLARAERIKTNIFGKYPDIMRAIQDPRSLKEVTIIAPVNGVLCRSRYDLLPPKEYGFTLDLKFTGLSAEPGEWARKMQRDYLFQADLYPRLLSATRGDKSEFRFLVVETDDLAASSLHAMAPSLAEIAETRVNNALGKWRDCLATGYWPEYPSAICYAEAPSWMITQDDERYYREQYLQEHSK